MLILGVILLIIGFVVGIHLLLIIGIVLAVAGGVLWIAGSTGHQIGSRRHWY